MKTPTTSKWKGYTLEQLRRQRELNEARIEAVSGRLRKRVEVYSSPSRAVATIADRVVNALGYIDYIVLGLKLWKHLRRWIR